MIQRIRQFYWAIWGKMDIGTHTFVRSYLTDDEQELFYAMHPADRFHSFHVALTAKEIYREERHLSSDDYIFLIRCALLHDIGKTKGTTDVWGKVLSVLARRFCRRYRSLFQKKTRVESAERLEPPFMFLIITRKLVRRNFG